MELSEKNIKDFIKAIVGIIEDREKVKITYSVDK